MINSVDIANYLLPVLGVVLSVIVMLTRKINTRDAICMARLALWSTLWLFWLWADWGSDFEPNILTVMARVTAIIINLLDVKKLTTKRDIKIRILKPKVDIHKN